MGAQRRVTVGVSGHEGEPRLIGTAADLGGDVAHEAAAGVFVDPVGEVVQAVGIVGDDGRAVA